MANWYTGKPPWAVKPKYVYFILARDARLVKIGISDNPSYRITALQTASPLPLELLGSFRGSIGDERDVHEMLAPIRQHGEWFAVCDWLRDVVGDLVGAKAAALLDDVPDHLSVEKFEDVEEFATDGR